MNEESMCEDCKYFYEREILDEWGILIEGVCELSIKAVDENSDICIQFEDKENRK